MFLVLPSGLVTLSRSGPASVGRAAADEYVLPGMRSQWSGATLRMAVTAAWTVSAQVEVVTSWGSFMIPKMTLGLSAYLVAREVQRAANSGHGKSVYVVMVNIDMMRAVLTIIRWASLADDLPVPPGIVVDINNTLMRT